MFTKNTCVFGHVHFLIKISMKTMASEVLHDKFNDNVRYLEIRYSPQLLMGSNLTCKQVVQTILNSAIKTETFLNSEANPVKRTEIEESGTTSEWPEFRIKFVLCGIWGCDDWLPELVDIIQEVDPKHDYLVAIDMAGNSAGPLKNPATVKSIEGIYSKARSLGIRATCHAGEDGASDTVVWAIENLGCSRVGHGYRLSEDTNAWNKYMIKVESENEEDASSTTHIKLKPKPNKLTKPGPHFEMCPLSSIYTNVNNMRENHVLKNLRPSQHNISISTDNSGLHFSTLSTEYDYLESDYNWNFGDFCEGNLNALGSSFGDLEDEYLDKFIKVYRMMIKL